MLCPLLTNLVRQILLENLLSDVASVPMVPQQILKIWQSYRLTKKRECVARGQRQILPNQIEGPRKFNDIFQEKKIWASIAGWNNPEEYFNKPIWGSWGGKPIFLNGQQMLKVLYHTKIWRWWVEMQLERKWKWEVNWAPEGKDKRTFFSKEIPPSQMLIVRDFELHQKARTLPSEEVDKEEGVSRLRSYTLPPKFTRQHCCLNICRYLYLYWLS